MRSRRIPVLPKWQPLRWVVANRLRVALGMPIPFAKYVDYRAVKESTGAPTRGRFLNVTIKREPQTPSPDRYSSLGPYFNR